jgi:hypothetical protein
MYNFWAYLISFFNSNFFVALVTGLTGAIAMILYNKQKRETRERIAISLINDIRNSWEAVELVRIYLRETGITPEITVLPENNWKKYSYLFTKDLDQDEMDITNKYFANIERVNYIVNQSNDTFITQIKDRDAALQNANLDIIKKADTVEDAITKINKLNLIFGDSKISSSPYYPQGFIDKLNKYLPEAIDLMNTPVGAKLKTIAKI